MKNKRNFENYLCLFIIFLGLAVINLNLSLLAKQRNSRGLVLASTTPGTNEIQFYYTSDGQRIAKLNPLVGNTYYVSPNLEIVYNKDGTFFWRKNYYFNGKLVAVKTTEPAITPPTITPAISRAPNPIVPSPTSMAMPLPTTVPVIPPSTITGEPMPTMMLSPTPGPNTPPVIVNVPAGNGMIGYLYNSYFSGNDVDLCYDNLSMWVSALPRGLKFNGCAQYKIQTGKQIACNISGYPTTKQTVNVTVYLSDGKVTVTRVIPIKIVPDTSP